MMRMKTLFAAATLLGASFLPVHAQGTDVGFTIPTQEEVEAFKEARRTHALGDRLARAVVEAFELYEAEDIPGAITVLEEVEPRTDYERAYVNRFLGTMYAALPEEQAQPEKALEMLQEAVGYDMLSFADQSASLQLLGNLQLQEERYEDSLQTMQTYLQFTGEWDADILFRMAAAHMELKNFDSVVAFARKANEHYAEPNRNPYVLMVGAYYEQNDIPNAIGVLEDGINAIPSETRWWSQLGAFYALNEQNDKALQTLAIAYDAGYLERSSDFRYLVQMFSNARIPYHAATVMTRHLESGDIDESQSNWASAARSYYTAREFEQAAETYSKAIELAEDTQDRVGYYRAQGDAYALAEEYRNAARSFQAALDLGPEDDSTTGRIYMSLAEAHFYSRQYRQALNAMENATRYSATRRNAESWIGFIRQTASNRGVDL
ncbi:MULTISPECIES: tetratricopeptide repeat protein [Gammaproteobacteria]|uniref:tetratricopeptide repeat protein n=1 Tax=Gammaproteobacteria TaxID=1236 RepID=UPI000DD0CBC5|nr:MULTISPECIES: tetratricopeptide repeat protein [Gammaproteobacteria]RTE85995.1 tetratricopeptide repeat protein [Aliidiomarina sp. B3213]TCZ91349.1 tetratricopeptide repeat protein [Lysobacter sp. N42]